MSRNSLKIVPESTAGDRFGKSPLIHFDSGGMTFDKEGEKVFAPSVNLISLNDIDLLSQ